MLLTPLKCMGGWGGGDVLNNRALQQQPFNPGRQKGPLLPQCLATNQSLTLE